MQENNNIKKQSNLVLGSYYIGKVLRYINMNIILYTILTQREFGLYRGINSAAFLLANLDLEKAIMKFYPSFKKDPDKRASFWGWSIIANTLLFLSIMIIFTTGQMLGKSSASSSDIHYYYPLIFFIGYVIQLAKVLKSWSIVLQQIVWPNILQNIILEILIGATFYLYYINIVSFKNLLLFMTIPYCLHLLFMIVYTCYRGKTRIAFNTHYINKKFIRNFVTYTLFVIVASKVTTFLMRIDAIMLAKLWGDSIVGKYMQILGVVTLLDIPYKVSRQSIGPILSQGFANHQKRKIEKIFQYAVIRQFLLASFVFFILYYNMGYFLQTSNQQQAQKLLLLMGTAKVLNNFFSVGLILLVLSHHYQYSIILSGIALLNIAINWQFIHLGGLYGAATAILFTTLFLGLSCFYLVWHTMRIHPFSWDILPLLMIFLGLIMVDSWLPLNTHLLIRIVRLAIPTFVYSAIFIIRSKINKNRA